MADDSKDSGQKTEDPTPFQLEQARNDGKVPNSREVTSFTLFLATTLLLYFIFRPLASKFLALTYQYIAESHNILVDTVSMVAIGRDAVFILLIVVSIPLVINGLAVILSFFLQYGGFLFSSKAIGFDLSRISFFKGLQRLFSLKSIVELVKGMLKISLVGTAAYFAVRSKIQDMESSFYLHIGATAELAMQIAIDMMVTVCFVMLIIAAVDFLYQKMEYMKELMMSHQDIKDEHKKTEGNPEIKSKQRSKRRELMKKFNIGDVIKADVVVTNPTHYAVALEYDPARMHAPKVVAKGSDLIALKIRQIATENLIPIVRNPILARTLFDSTDIGDFIPVAHYKAVAEIVSYVMNINKGSRIAAFVRKKEQQEKERK